MRRFLLSAIVALGMAVSVQAHAILLVVKNNEVVLVFSDNLEPDTRVKEATWNKVGTPKLNARSGDTVTVIETKVGEACRTAALPASTTMIYGTTDYGISTHGEKPKALTFYYKAVTSGTGAAATIGTKAALEIVPHIVDGKTVFQVLAAGKPVKDAEVTVTVPDVEDKETVKTDADGKTTGFTAKGRYAALVRLTVTQAGELNGEKYEEVGTTATLVYDAK